MHTIHVKTQNTANNLPNWRQSI